MWTTSPSSRFLASLVLVTAHFAGGHARAVEGPPNAALVPVIEAVVEIPVNHALVDPAAPAPAPVPAVDIANYGAENGAAPRVPAVTIPGVPLENVVPAPLEPVIPPVDVAPTLAPSALVSDAAALLPAATGAVASLVSAVNIPSLVSIAPLSIPLPTDVLTRVTSLLPVTSELPVQQNTTSTTNRNGTYVHTTKAATRSFTTILVSSVFNTVTAQMPSNTALPTGAAVSGAPEVVYAGGLDDSTLDTACWSGKCEDVDSKMTTAHVINLQKPGPENAGSRLVPAFGAVLTLALGLVAFM